MKTFQEYLKEKEAIEEGWGKNLNGRKVPLTPKEQSHVKAIEQLRKSMGN
jgi:hypothetical protein